MSATPRILIVDDELAVLGLLKRYLERLGYAVEITSSGEAALVLFEAAPERYDLVITDLNLPGIGGEELLQRMRRQRPSQKALISSGYPHQPMLSNVGFLLKPYLPQMMVEAIDQMLG